MTFPVNRLEISTQQELEFSQARYPIEHSLPIGRDYSFADARQAVKAEYRDSVKWKRMRCRSVRKISDSDEGMIYLLEVGHAVEFDWTWEGSTAFRPLNLRAFADDPGDAFDDENTYADIDDSILWSGEVLEVDETAGHVYICIADPEFPPTTGSFYIRPFEFLAVLNAVFNYQNFESLQKLLPSRLLACEGNVHPEVDSYRSVGLTKLHEWWSRSWSHLWGPPGTGKTFTTGQQVAKVLEDPTERILVVSTTNRATDAAAIAIGRASKTDAPRLLEAGALLRIGKGTSLKHFENEDLTEMLRGTEAAYLAKIDELSTELARSDSSERRSSSSFTVGNLS